MKLATPPAMNAANRTEASIKAAMVTKITRTVLDRMKARCGMFLTTC
jgi:hypothetical protein